MNLHIPLHDPSEIHKLGLIFGDEVSTVNEQTGRNTTFLYSAVCISRTRCRANLRSLGRGTLSSYLEDTFGRMISVKVGAAGAVRMPMALARLRGMSSFNASKYNFPCGWSLHISRIKVVLPVPDGPIITPKPSTTPCSEKSWVNYLLQVFSVHMSFVRVQ